jgi:transcriptional regulator with XRE-family HTH domain
MSKSIDLAEVARRRHRIVFMRYADPVHGWRDILIQARARQRISQADLAEIMGTSQSAVSDLEAGVQDVRLGALERWAVALGYRVTVSLEQVEETPDV